MEQEAKQKEKERNGQGVDNSQCLETLLFYLCVSSPLFV